MYSFSARAQIFRETNLDDEALYQAMDIVCLNKSLDEDSL